MLQGKIWVLGTRTPACGGTIRLAIFRYRKLIPANQEASVVCVASTSGSSLLIRTIAQQVQIKSLPINKIESLAEALLDFKGMADLEIWLRENVV